MKDSFYIKIKSFIDPVLAVLSLVLSSPLLLVITILIKVDSPGPVIFSQTRLGKNKSLFRFYKFRTMRHNAKGKYPYFYQYKYTKKEIGTMRFKLLDDPRLTKFGKYLRKTSLDELPNLINVIQGKMSLIGPRPEIPEMLRYYRKDQMAKFLVKPGITGYAQVNGRGLLTFQETISFDLKYVLEQSFLTDMKILIKTVGVVIKGLGAF